MDSGQGWIVDTTDKLEKFIDFVKESFKDSKHHLYLRKYLREQRE